MRMMMSIGTTLHTTMGSSYSIAPEAGTSSVSSTTVPPKSPWHSPVPYLFGGLAAMLGLIAFALLILACSYWKLSRDETQQQQQQQQQQSNDDLESGGDRKGDGISKMNGVPVFEEKIVVIMAGNDKPTFLATPALMLSSSKSGDSNDDHHAMLGSTIAKHDDDEANKESSSVVDDDDDDDDHHKEDEATHQPHD